MAQLQRFGAYAKSMGLIDDATKLPKFQSVFVLLVIAIPLLGNLSLGIYFLCATYFFRGFWKGLYSSSSKGSKYLFLSFMIYFWGLLAISAAHGLDVFTYSKYDQNIGFLILAPLILFVSQNISGVDFRKIVIPAFIFLALAAVLLSFEKIILGVQRPSLWATNPIPMSIAIVLSTLMFMLDWDKKNRFERGISYAAFFVAFLTISFVTETRSALLVLVAVIAIFVLSISAPKNANLAIQFKRLSVVSILIAGALTMIVFVFRDFGVFGRIWSVTDLSNLDLAAANLDANSTRILLYEAAFEAIKEAPLFGYGLQNSFSAIEPYLDQSTTIAHVHSEYLRHILAGGVVGLALWLNIVVSPIVFYFLARPRSRNLLLVCLGFATILGLASLFDRTVFHMFRVPILMLYFIFISALECEFRRKQNN